MEVIPQVFSPRFSLGGNCKFASMQVKYSIEHLSFICFIYVPQREELQQNNAVTSHYRVNCPTQASLCQRL